MLYECAARFDVTENLEKFLVFGYKLNKAQYVHEDTVSRVSKGIHAIFFFINK